jgi:hypothetical protein
LRFSVFLISQQAVTHIKEEVGLVGLGIAKSIDGGAARSGDFDADAEAGELDRVESGRSLLVGARRLRVERGWVTCGGLDKNVAVLGAAAGAADVGLAKAADVAVCIPAGVGIVFIRGDHIWTGLDHSERHGWTWEDIASTRRTEKRIHRAGELTVSYRRKK